MNSGSDLGKDKSHWISRHLPLPESCSHYRHPLPSPRPRSTAKRRDLPHWRRPGFQLPVWFSIKADMSCQAWSLLWRLVRYLLLWLFYRGPRWPPKGYLLVPSTHLPNLEGILVGPCPTSLYPSNSQSDFHRAVPCMAIVLIHHVPIMPSWLTIWPLPRSR